MKIYSVYDSAAQAFLPPFFAAQHAAAIRSFTDAANEEGHQFHRHADDYTLFYIGDHSTESGELTPVEPHSLGTALQYVVPKAPDPQMALPFAVEG